MTMQTVYDIGMHDGSDTAYYLATGRNVVSVDANPAMCRKVEERFASEIRSGRLKVLNVGISDSSGEADFYINTAITLESTFAPKNPENKVWEKVVIPTARLSDIVAQNGEPYYIKIDVEGFDAIALGHLLDANIRPPFISAEVHTVEPICIMVAMGYDGFHLRNCRNVPQQYGRQKVAHLDGSFVQHIFPWHSSGPFGEDIPDAWVNHTTVLYQWFGRDVLLGRGWHDVHACRLA